MFIRAEEDCFNFTHTLNVFVLNVSRAQHQWQPKGEQKKTGGNNWAPTQMSQATTNWTQPSFQQQSVSSICFYTLNLRNKGGGGFTRASRRLVGFI